MAIRRPSVFAQNQYVFQDFLDYTDGPEELRYLLIKWDGENFSLVKQTFDYNPPDFIGGPIIGRIDYSKVGQVIRIYHWEVNWRDEWPLRLGVQYLVNCLYKPESGFNIIVDKEQYAFWVSENFFPSTNSSDDYLMQDF